MLTSKILHTLYMQNYGDGSTFLCVIKILMVRTEIRQEWFLGVLSERIWTKQKWNLTLPNFTSKQFDYLQVLISWMTNYGHNHRFFKRLSYWLSIKNSMQWELYSLNFGLSSEFSEFSEFFDKIPDRIILDVLYRVLRVF